MSFGLTVFLILLFVPARAFCQQPPPALKQLQLQLLPLQDFLTPAIATIIAAVIAGATTALLGPWVKEKFVVREQYVVPFKKWCGELYGELTEFKSRYAMEKDGNFVFSQTEISDVLIILDFRSLHEALIDAPKWIGKIEKDEGKESVACKNLRDLIDMVEKGWHALENEHGNELPSAESTKKFNEGIKGLENDKRNAIATQIRTHLKEKRTYYTGDKFERISDYLHKQVPTER